MNKLGSTSSKVNKNPKLTFCLIMTEKFLSPNLGDITKMYIKFDTRDSSQDY